MSARRCPCGYINECVVHCGKGHENGKCDRWQPRTCLVYRTQAKSLKSEHDTSNYNESDQVQFEACVFTDGRVAQRWLTETGSMVWWNSWRDLCNVHIYAHPDYGTRVEWSNGEVEEL